MTETRMGKIALSRATATQGFENKDRIILVQLNHVKFGLILLQDLRLRTGLAL
jgi:hypothetical protein